MSNIKLKGVGRAIIKRSNGKIDVVENSNMIVNVGKDFIIKSLIMTGSNRPNPLGWVAIGKGTGATSPTMTKLVNESNRKAGTFTYDGNGTSFTVSATYMKGYVSGVITEGGVFNSDVGGVMFDRVLFSPSIEIGADDEYTQEFTFTV